MSQEYDNAWDGSTARVEDAYSPSRSRSTFWTVYWGLVGILATGALLVALASGPPEAVGWFGFSAMAFLWVGLAPWLVGSAERKVDDACRGKVPGYAPGWPARAKAYLLLHWIAAAVVGGLFVLSGAQPRPFDRELFLIVAVLLSCFYLFAFMPFVIAWRVRRVRLADFAAQAPALGLRFQFDRPDLLNGAWGVLPWFRGKLRGDRCPFALEGDLGDWRVAVFDWHEIDQERQRRQWITVTLVLTNGRVPNVVYQPEHRLRAEPLHWFHLFFHFPFGLILVALAFLTRWLSNMRQRESIRIEHTPELTRRYHLHGEDSVGVVRCVTREVGRDLLKYVTHQQRMLCGEGTLLAVATTKGLLDPDQLPAFVADTLRMADLFERQMSGPVTIMFESDGQAEMIELS